MPIYAYKCDDCGCAKDVLQKMSDPLLSECPNCGKATFVKQLTAAGFQLKGSGWYATDFKGGNGATAAPAPVAAEVGGATEAAPTQSAAAGPVASTVAAPAASGCGGGCACHS